MAKFYGQIGYINETTRDENPDCFFETPIEKYYKGDLLKNSRRLVNSGEVNDNIQISNQISIVADPYALSHIFAMRYVKWMGAAWKIDDIDVEFPRLILTLGGVYNGETS